MSARWWRSWWAHLALTRVNIELTFIKYQIEDVREAHEYMSVPHLSSADEEVDLRISPRRLRPWQLS